MRLLRRSKPGRRPCACGVQVRAAVRLPRALREASPRERQRRWRACTQRRRVAVALEGSHRAAPESLPSGFQARHRTAPRRASARALAHRHRAAFDGAHATQQHTRLAEKAVPLESLVPLERAARRRWQGGLSRASWLPEPPTRSLVESVPYALKTSSPSRMRRCMRASILRRSPGSCSGVSGR